MADLCSGMSTDRSFVQQAKLFEGLDAASLDTILNLATPRSVPRGATLFKQGDKPCWLTLITAGTPEDRARRAGWPDLGGRLLGTWRDRGLRCRFPTRPLPGNRKGS